MFAKSNSSHDRFVLWRSDHGLFVISGFEKNLLYVILYYCAFHEVAEPEIVDLELNAQDNPYGIN